MYRKSCKIIEKFCRCVLKRQAVMETVRRKIGTAHQRCQRLIRKSSDARGLSKGTIENGGNGVRAYAYARVRQANPEAKQRESGVRGPETDRRGVCCGGQMAAISARRIERKSRSVNVITLVTTRPRAEGRYSAAASPVCSEAIENQQSNQYRRRRTRLDSHV